MKSPAVLLVFVLSLSAAEGGPFTATLSTPQVHEMGEDVTCDIIITNNHDMDYLLLMRDTPLKSLKSHIFTIKKGTKFVVKYDGFLTKRGPPMEEEYIRIPGKFSLSSTVVLSKAYSFDSASVYSVKLDTHLLYSKSLTATPLSQHLYSNTRHFFLVSTGKPPKLTEPEDLRKKEQQLPPKVNSQGYVSPTFHGAWPYDEKNATQVAYSTAFSAVSKSRIVNRGAYTTWFGILIDTRLTEVMRVYNSVWFAMSEHPYRLDYYGEGCESASFAYTWYSSKTIVLCKQYFNAEMTGYNSKMGIIIHQMTHSVSNTEDIPGGYGVIGAMNIATTDANKAIRNADAYEYYCESV